MIIVDLKILNTYILRKDQSTALLLSDETVRFQLQLLFPKKLSYDSVILKHYNVPRITQQEPHGATQQNHLTV